MPSNLSLREKVARRVTVRHTSPRRKELHELGYKQLALWEAKGPRALRDIPKTREKVTTLGQIAQSIQKVDDL